MAAPEITVLVTPDCPHADATLRLVEAVADRLSPGSTVEIVRVPDAETARAVDFPGSPTVRVGGEDLEGPGDRQPAFACRMYEGGGMPPRWVVEAALLRALEPRHLLFLCVANSARSQMAEGIARSLAPSWMRVSSAGSEPTRIRPQAVRALEEIGVDASGQRSKGMEEIEGEVDAVITLCAEEACPAWLGDAWRLHWPLPDPAGAGAEPEEEMEAFRAARDELRRRLATLFGE